MQYYTYYYYVLLDIAFSADGNKLAFLTALDDDFSSYNSAVLIVLNSEDGL